MNESTLRERTFALLACLLASFGRDELCVLRECSSFFFIPSSLAKRANNLDLVSRKVRTEGRPGLIIHKIEKSNDIRA